VSFKALADEWLRLYPATHNLKPATLTNHGTAIAHLNAFFGNKEVAAILPDHVEEFIVAKRRAPGVAGTRRDGLFAEGSVRITLNTLKLILDRAVRKRLLQANPVTAAEVKIRQKSNADPLDSSEIARVLEAAVSPLFRTMLRMWFCTGMRRGELLGLKYGDLDLVRGEVSISRTFSRCELGTPKTDGATRVVSFQHPVTDPAGGWEPDPSDRELVDALGALRRDPEAFLWHSHRPFPEDMLGRFWKATLARAGVRNRTPEQARHTFASTMLSRNAPLLYVQECGGWADATTLLRHYSKWMPRVRPAAVAQPNAIPAQPTLRVVK
jgi:integrase